MTYKNLFKQIFIISVFVVFVFLPISTNATTAVKPKIIPTVPLEVSGWIPYWREATGTADAIAHIKTFTEISPFGFTVKNNGTLFDALGLASSTAWQNLIQTAKANKVKVIPTVMWSDGNMIDKILRDPKLRKAHVAEIIKMLNTYGFDGVDIDYEGKLDKTMNYFSLFLHDLYNATGKRLVVCSIEPRTPLDSRYNTIPTNITYANDFTAINKYCDRVRIMTYDQGIIDLKLNKSAIGPYNPIADPQWVEKVINLTAKTISKSKIEIGVATYGHEYEITPNVGGGYTYNFLTSFNPKYAWDIASQNGITPTRNSAGEMSFSYVSTTTSTTNFFSWSDALAINDEIALAKKLGVRGIAIFKIDGGEDPLMWQVLQNR